MDRTYLLSIILNLLITILIVTVLENVELIAYSQLDTNVTETPTTAATTTTTAANVTETPTTAATTTTTAANVTETPTTAATKKLNYCYQSQWGTIGKGDSQFLRPHDIIFDSKGYLYVNDRERNDFQKFSLDGKFISKFGEKGEKLGQFKSPYSMAIDSNDNIYVLDRGNDSVQKISTDGTPLGALYSYDGVFVKSNDDIAKADLKDKKPSKEEKLKQFASPEAMAIDKEGNFYVTDTGHNRIIKFDKNFKYISHFGEVGSGPSQFDHPHGIGIDSDGNILINELNNARIQKFTNDGKFIKQWGSEGKWTGPIYITFRTFKS